MTSRALCFALALVLAGALSARANTITMNVDTLVVGNEPTSIVPWLVLTFKDFAPDTVRLTITSNLEALSEFFGGSTNFGVAFNVDPSILPSSVGLTEFSRTGSFLNDPVISKDVQNAQHFPPLGLAPETGFDFRIGLSQGSAKFGLVEQVVFTLTASGLDALDFNYTNPLGYFAGGHLQGIIGGGSAKVVANSSSVELDATAVPDGGTTMTLLGCALLGLGLMRRKFGA